MTSKEWLKKENVSDRDFMEIGTTDLISNLIDRYVKEVFSNKWIELKSEDDLPKTYKTIDLWFVTKTGHITINNWNSKFKHKTFGYLNVYSHYQIVINPELP